MHRTDKHLEHSSVIWSVWLNSWVFVYELSGFGFGFSCSHLNYWFFLCDFWVQTVLIPPDQNVSIFLYQIVPMHLVSNMYNGNIRIFWYRKSCIKTWYSSKPLWLLIFLVWFFWIQTLPIPPKLKLHQYSTNTTDIQAKWLMEIKCREFHMWKENFFLVTTIDNLTCDDIKQQGLVVISWVSKLPVFIMYNLQMPASHKDTKNSGNNFDIYYTIQWNFLPQMFF